MVLTLIAEWSATVASTAAAVAAAKNRPITPMKAYD